MLNRFTKFQKSVFVATAVIIILIGWFFIKNANKKLPLPETADAKAVQEIPLLAVNEDTLTSLFNSFFKIRNIENGSVINASGKKYNVQIKKFGNNPLELLNNPKIISARQLGFSLSINSSGDIAGEFARFEKNNANYVNIPTDIFFRLLVNKNNLKQEYVRHK